MTRQNAKAKMEVVEAAETSTLDQLIGEMKSAFPERAAVIDTMADATIAGEHVLLLGTPGTAKSQLTRAWAEGLGLSFFDALITRYTEPNELFGPYSLKAFEEDRYARQMVGYAPPAAVWFLDEVFKGSSAILNSLLTAINERRLRDDGAWIDLDLKLCIGASNELPGDSDGLGAFHDRFTVRHLVASVEDDDAFSDVMWGRLPQVQARIDPQELADLATKARTIGPTEEVDKSCKDIRDALREKNIPCSDRRWAKAAKLLAARSARLGRREISSTSLGLLEHVLWNRPEEIAAVREIVRAHVATWLREIQEAGAAIEEQDMALKEAKRKKGSVDKTASALAQIHQRLAEIQSESLDVALKDSPEAKGDVAALEARIAEIRKGIQKAMRQLGF